jgi:hypothetical protein
LHKLLVRWAPATVVRDVLEPAIADLQYEAARAPTAYERRHVIFRGHAAIVRALVFSIEPGGVLRPVLALATLCAAGTLLLTMAYSSRVDGRVLNSAILGPGMLAPIILRILGTTSARRLFLGSLVVALLTPALANGFALEGAQPVWIRLERALALLVLFAPIAAAAAIVAGPARDTLRRRAVTAVSFGGGLATAALVIAHWPQGQHLSIDLAMTPFYVVLFAALFALTLLPLLLVARAFIARPGLLAFAGLLCSPAPWIAGAYLDHGTLTACLDALRRAPLSFAASSLPFVTGAITVGWRLPPCGQPPNSVARS